MSECILHGYCECPEYRDCACGNQRAEPHCMWCCLPKRPEGATCCPKCGEEL